TSCRHFRGMGAKRERRLSDTVLSVARRLTADAGGLFDPAQRPSESAQRQHLLLFGVAQDVAHGGEGTCVPRRRQRLGCYAWWPVSAVDQWPVLGVHRGD